MTPTPSPEQHPVPSLADERERIIQQLSEHFANDRLSMDELESRLELVYKAANLDELRRLTADLPAPTAVAPVVDAEIVAAAPDRDRVVAIMSETKRKGAWLVPQRLGVFALMSDTTIDLTQATLPAGIIDIHVRSMMAAVKLIVPPGIQVVSRVGSLMGSVHGGGEPDATPGVPNWRAGTVVRLSGWACMAEVAVKVRRREKPESDD
jgi:uncharacterized protein DUF1707/cell wall-active antibiotic response 4TMS protein YvqF